MSERIELARGASASEHRSLRAVPGGEERASARPAARERFLTEPHEVRVVVPNDIDDPTTPSGGNVYDRRICIALARVGWVVREHPAYGGWPEPDAAAQARLAQLLATLPDRRTVLDRRTGRVERP